MGRLPPTYCCRLPLYLPPRLFRLGDSPGALQFTAAPFRVTRQRHQHVLLVQSAASAVAAAAHSGGNDLPGGGTVAVRYFQWQTQ